MPYFDFRNHKLFYRIQGKGSLLIVLPGNTASSICHQPELDYFSKDFTTVSLDYLGTGKSDRLTRFSDHWYAECAEQTYDLINHLTLGPAVLLGTSGGAVVALHTAAHFPKQVRAVIADSFTPSLTQELLQHNVINERKKPSENQAAFWSYAHGEDWAEVVQMDTAMLVNLVQSGGEWLKDVLDRVSCPVFFTASLEDNSLVNPTAHTLAMLNQVKDGRAFFSQHGGHPLIWSAPEEFRLAIKGFLDAYRLSLK